MFVGGGGVFGAYTGYALEHRRQANRGFDRRQALSAGGKWNIRLELDVFMRAYLIPCA